MVTLLTRLISMFSFYIPQILLSFCTPKERNVSNVMKRVEKITFGFTMQKRYLKLISNRQELYNCLLLKVFERKILYGIFQSIDFPSPTTPMLPISSLSQKKRIFNFPLELKFGL